MAENKEQYLLKAILYLLLYVGLGESVEMDKLKPLLVSGATEPTNYGHPKTPMA